MGGTYTVFRTLRPALVDYGIVLRWVGLAPAGGGTVPPELHGELEWGSFVRQSSDECERVAALYQHLSQGAYDGVIVNILCGAIETNMARYLPARMPRVAMVHSTTRGTYVAARSVRDHVSYTIAVSPRIRADLIRGYGFREDRVAVVPNAEPNGTGNVVAPKRGTAGKLKILSLGRIEDSSKGVLLLPDIVGRIRSHDWELTIAGDGPDLGALKKACLTFKDKVEFVGATSPERTRELFSEHDVFLMPSRYEGFGITLIEAMAHGCVPVASRIRGVTDWIVRHAETGFLFSIGDIEGAAQALELMARDPLARQEIGSNAQREVQARFRADLVAAEYANVLHRAMARPVTPRAPLDVKEWQLPKGLRPGFRSRLPEPLKVRLRAWRERLAR